MMDESALLAMLSRAVDGAELRYEESPTVLAGGFSSELYRFSLRDAPAPLDGPLVVRLMHDDEAARETAIQCTIAGLGFAVPAAHLHGDSRAGLGRPFLVMDLVSGADPAQVSGPRTAIRAFRDVPPLLARVMASLHALDPAPVRAALSDRGVTIEELGARAVLGELAGEPWLAPVLDWLEPRRIEADTEVVCHGDLHALNLLVEGTSITAVLDWELATLAAPEYDVARTSLILATVPVPMPRGLRPLVQALGRRSARVFRAAYRELRPLDDESLVWHDALHCARTLALVARHRRAAPGDGLGDGPGALWDPVAPAVARRLEEATGLRLTPPR